MPEMDGMAATRKIRDLPGETGKLPIIALTANAMKGDRETYLAGGMSDYLPKPVNPTDLTAAIAKWSSKPERADGDQDGASRDRSSIDELPVLDQAVMDNLTTGLGDEMMTGLIKQCVNDLRASLVRIIELGIDEDFGAMVRLAHDLKSSSGGFGAVRLQRCAQELEVACKEKRKEDVRQILSEIGPVAHEAIEALDAEYELRSDEATQSRSATGSR